MDNQKLHPFVCGLCNCSYDRFVSFYKHFKNHSEEIGQDSFHICEDLQSSERDGCEDLSESPEIPTFNCGICPASFITVCMLHEHMENHESKGSYTLDMQSKTGYPSPQQYPCVRLDNVKPRSMPDGISEDVKSRRGRPSKYRHLDAALSMPRKRTSRGRPSIYTDQFNAQGTGWKTLRRGTPTLHDAFKGIISHEANDRNSIYVTKEDDSVLPTAEIELKSGRPQKHLTSKQACSIPQNVKSRPRRRKRSQYLNIQSDYLDIIKSEPADAMQDNVKVCKENSEEGSNDNEINMDVDTNRYNANHDDDDCASDYNQAIAAAADDDDDEYINSGCAIDVKVLNLDANAELESENTDNIPETLKTGIDCEKKVKTESTEIEEETTYKLRQLSHRDKAYNRKGYRKKGKSKKKVKSKQNEDADYDPKVDFKILPSRKDRNAKRVMMKCYGRRKSLVQCKHCGMAIPVDNIKKHEYAHNTRAGRLKYAPENLTKCEECNRILLKTLVNKHKCCLIVIKEKKTEDKEQQLKAKHRLTPCHICGILFKQMHLKGHLLSHSDARPYPCQKCSMAFKTRDILKSHERAVHGERSFQCDKCPWAFTTKQNLKEHCQRRHTRERSFTCTTCGKQYKTNHHLKRHMHVHDVVPSFACKECPRVFKMVGCLRGHVKPVHRKQKHWFCSWEGCGKTFFAGPALRRHMLVHTGEKPEKCTLCESAFSQRQELKTHLRKKHNTDKMPPPNDETPYSDVVPHLIRPQANDDDTRQSITGGPVYKTIMFTKASLSKTEKQKLQYQLFVALQQSQSTCSRGREIKSTVQSKLDMGPNSALSVDNAKTEQTTNDRYITEQSTIQSSLDRETYPVLINSDAKTEQWTIDNRDIVSEEGCAGVEALQEKEGKGKEKEEKVDETTTEQILKDGKYEQNDISSEATVCVTDSTTMSGTSNLSIYRNTNCELRTSHTSTYLMQGANNISGYSSTRPDYNFDNTVLRQNKCDLMSVLPSASNMPMYSNTTQELGASSSSLSLMYDDVKAELDPGSMDMQNNYISAGSLSSVGTGSAYLASDYDTF